MRLRSQVQFTQEIIRGISGQATRVYVDSPYRFLKRFTDMMGIEFAADEKAAATRDFVKIDGVALLRICLECGVVSIRIDTDKQTGQTIRMSARADASQRSREALDKIEAAFGGRIRAEFTA